MNGDSLYLNSLYQLRNPGEGPVRAVLLQGGIGLIRVNSFFGDSVLISRSWEDALKLFKDYSVTQLIIDVRPNGGGSPNLATYFAGSFYKKSFVLTQSYQATKDGQFGVCWWRDSRSITYPMG